MPKLILVSSENTGGEFNLDGGDPFTVGRGSGCTVSLDNRMVSRRHASIERRENGYYIEDTNSYNGTFVNARRLAEPCRLHDGDEIRIAGHCFRFVEHAEAAGGSAGLETPPPTGAAYHHTPIEKVDVPITSDDFDSLWKNLTAVDEAVKGAAPHSTGQGEQADGADPSPAKETTAGDVKMQFSLTPEDLDSLGAPPSLGDNRAPREQAGNDGDAAAPEITSEIFADLDADEAEEEENKLVQLRRIVRGMASAEAPDRFASVLGEYIDLNWKNPEILDLLEGYIQIQMPDGIDNEERLALRGIIGELERKRPSWVNGRRFEAVKTGLT